MPLNVGVIFGGFGIKMLIYIDIGGGGWSSPIMNKIVDMVYPHRPNFELLTIKLYTFQNVRESIVLSY